MRRNYENWLRVITLVNCAGKRLCYEILHINERLPCDGGKLYAELECYKNNMHYRMHEEILCPSNKVIDETKFDLLVYATVIYYKFDDRYEELLEDVGDMRNKIFHMPHELICQTELEILWDDACDMLRRHNFDTELLKVLKNCDLFSAEEYQGILEFVSFL